MTEDEVVHLSVQIAGIRIKLKKLHNTVNDLYVEYSGEKHKGLLAVPSNQITFRGHRIFIETDNPEDILRYCEMIESFTEPKRKKEGS